MDHPLSRLREAADPTYYQDTFYFTILIAMTKDIGGSRDETKNDIRALPEILTVTLVEPEKGGVQRDVGSKYLSTLKLHVRRPKGINKNALMKRLVLNINNLRGVSVLRYKERPPTQRRRPFHGSYKITEGEYYQSRRHKRNLQKAEKELTQTGPNSGGPYKDVEDEADWESAPPGAPGGLEEIQLDEAMKSPSDLPDGVVVVVKSRGSQGFSVYYARADHPDKPLKAHDLDRQEAGIDIYGTVVASPGEPPRDDVWMVKSSRARDGFGPLLYDVALETAGASGLKGDNLDVSPDASALWKHYDMHRTDVESEMLADGPEDYELFMPPELAIHPEKSEHLAKAYFKKDKATIEELIDQDKYIEIGATQGPLYEGSTDQLLEDILITIGGNSDELLAFDVQPALNQKIWEGDKRVRPGVKGALMAIVEEFMEGLDMDLDLTDVIITGSLANYNWSKFSDIDLHLLVDFSEVNENEKMVKKFFDAVRSNWNKLHNILIKGHEVEIYVQDAHEPHVSTGVYSLLEDRWLVKPKKVKPLLDRASATKKMKQIAREVDKLSSLYDNERYEESFDMATRIKEKLKRMRRAGLERSGIYSPENLAFKMLRRSGDIEQLFAIYTGAYDHLYSVEQ